MKIYQIVMLLSNPFRPDTRVLKEAESLQSMGYAVTILCWDREAAYASKETLPSGVQIIRVQNVPSSYGIGSRQLFRLVKFWSAVIPILNRLRPDLIHCHDFDTLPVGLYWCRLHRRPVVYDAHEYYAELVRPRLQRFPGNLIYHMIRISESTGARLASGVITVDEKLGAIYRRLNKNVLIIGHYPTLKNIQKAAPVFTQNELNLAYVGRVSTDRGMLIYLELLDHLRQAGIPARLHLVGAFTPTSEEETLWRYAKGLEEWVSWLGWVEYDQIPGLLNNFDIGLVILKPEPRYVAALPVKLFEYMSAGLPILASDFPEIAKIVRESNCGALVDPEKDPALIVEIVKNWWANPEVPRLLGYNGFKAARKKFYWEKTSDQIDGLYRSLLHK
ncbi:MAG TPA: glycosyltransferase family 4 protein [Anaerolineales bacterium]|nr:glycosyltransferase family 4 protein [Anaerolineales bacterium]